MILKVFSKLNDSVARVSSKHTLLLRNQVARAILTLIFIFLQ